MDKVDKPLDAFTWYVGYNKVVGWKPNYKNITDYNALSSEVFSRIDPDCFDWIKLVDGYYEKLEEKDKESASLVLDYKVEIDRDVLSNWIKRTFTPDVVQQYLQDNDTEHMELNFLLHPVIKTGMQLEDLPSIIKPLGILKTKVLDEVSFEIKRSIIIDSQKIFTIMFVDNDTEEELYSETSYDHPENFFITTKNGEVSLTSLVPENSIFEQLSKTEYPINKFIVTYKIPSDVITHLSEHLNYSIIIKITDLTSEWRP